MNNGTEPSAKATVDHLASCWQGNIEESSCAGTLDALSAAFDEQLRDRGYPPMGG